MADEFDQKVKELNLIIKELREQGNESRVDLQDILLAQKEMQLTLTQVAHQLAEHTIKALKHQEEVNRLLHGELEKPGMLVRLDRLEQTVKAYVRITWIVITAGVVGLIGLLFKNGTH